MLEAVEYEVCPAHVPLVAPVLFNMYIAIINTIVRRIRYSRNRTKESEIRVLTSETYYIVIFKTQIFVNSHPKA